MVFLYPLGGYQWESIYSSRQLYGYGCRLGWRATSQEDVSALMEGKKANLIVTDPPYNVAFKNMAEHLEIW